MTAVQSDTPMLSEATTDKIIRCAMRVQNKLGPGLKEVLYQRTLPLEMEEAGLSYEVERPVEIYIDGTFVGRLYLDHLVEDRVVVEEKALSHLLTQEEIAQVITYLCATGLKVGLLLDLGRRRLEYKRIFPPMIVTQWQDRIRGYVWNPRDTVSAHPLPHSLTNHER